MRLTQKLLRANAFIILLIFSASVYCQDSDPPDPPAGFEKIEQMIPMRDGVKLHTIAVGRSLEEYRQRSAMGPGRVTSALITLILNWTADATK